MCIYPPGTVLLFYGRPTRWRYLLKDARWIHHVSGKKVVSQRTLFLLTLLTVEMEAPPVLTRHLSSHLTHARVLVIDGDDTSPYLVNPSKYRRYSGTLDEVCHSVTKDSTIRKVPAGPVSSSCVVVKETSIQQSPSSKGTRFSFEAAVMLTSPLASAVTPPAMAAIPIDGMGACKGKGSESKGPLQLDNAVVVPPPDTRDVS
jgi:hypothetical protein